MKTELKIMALFALMVLLAYCASPEQEVDNNHYDSTYYRAYNDSILQSVNNDSTPDSVR